MELNFSNLKYSVMVVDGYNLANSCKTNYFHQMSFTDFSTFSDINLSKTEVKYKSEVRLAIVTELWLSLRNGQKLYLLMFSFMLHFFPVFSE